MIKVLILIVVLLISCSDLLMPCNSYIQLDGIKVALDYLQYRFDIYKNYCELNCVACITCGFHEPCFEYEALTDWARKSPRIRPLVCGC